ncbi:hypothetical protein ACLB2K_032169 [Fragaria x ananassa]
MLESEQSHRSFAWPGLHRDVKKYVAECDTCQRNHGENVLPPGHLQPLYIPAQAWQDITMDFIEALPKAEGKSVICVIVDKLTKYSHFIALAHPSSAESLAHVFVKEVFKLHGMPSDITSDRDPIFMSLFWDSFFQLQGTKLSRSSDYHPQSDGQTENLNKTLEQFLRCVVGERPQLWVQALPWAEWWYNTAYHSSIQMYPFEALYERSFEVGDMVFLKLQPYKQQLVHQGAFHKLSAKYFGPFEVLEKIGAVAYKLRLPPTARIHDVFHVSLLKKKLGNDVTVEPHLPLISDANKRNWKPAKVLETRLVKRRGNAAAQWLILWDGTSSEEATWEYADDAKRRLPEFDSDA